ncbi:Uncharacterised protein [Chlamydia trachomatis]|nr:Uncharacterised protein [Chlamydia trachomatis]
MVVTAIAAVTTHVRPKRFDSGTASTPMRAKTIHGNAESRPTAIAPTPKVDWTPVKTGPSDVAPARIEGEIVRTATSAITVDSVETRRGFTPVDEDTLSGLAVMSRSEELMHPGSHCALWARKLARDCLVTVAPPKFSVRTIRSCLHPHCPFVLHLVFHLDSPVSRAKVCL